MGKNYSRIIFTINAEAAVDIVPALFSLGCEGIEEKAMDEHIAFFTEDRVEDALAFLQERRIRCEAFQVEDRDWHAEWKKNLKPVELTSTFWVAPSWLLGNLREQKTILIEPKMAFGTGHHETTKMCAQYIENLAPGAASLLDVGTGSGLLAILGEKSGLSSIVALDNDPSVVENLEENIHQNQCANIHAFIGTLDALSPGRPFDILSANIISSVIIPLLPAFHCRMHAKSRLILSGLLLLEKKTILSLLGDNEFSVVSDTAMGEWYAVLVRKK